MSILLTGQPHSGKTTLLNRIVGHFDSKQGFITEEILKNGQRVGFQILTADGRKERFAHVDFAQNTRVSKYGVDLDVLNDVIVLMNVESGADLLYVDEIGEMQLFSKKFKQFIETCLDSDKPFIATLTSVYSDDFTKSIATRQDVNIIEVNKSNRDDLEAQIVSKLQNAIG